MSPSIFEGKLDPRLRSYLQGIDLQSLSRIDASRLATRAMPNIGCIELVSGDAFATLYDALYVSMFPKRAERERSDLIVKRLAEQDAGERAGLAPYRIVGIRDGAGAAIGAAQFSVLPLPGGEFAVPYLQYIYVRAENRRQDMSEVMHTLVLGVAAADAAKMESARTGGRTVPFTLFEAEPAGHGDDDASRAFSRSRTQIHDKSGGVALMLVREKGSGRGGGQEEEDDDEEEQISSHVQPGLEEDDPPLTLLWVIRQSPHPGQPYDVKVIGRDLLAAYYRSLRDEGFPEKNIRLAEEIVEERCKGLTFQLIPLSRVSVHNKS